MTTRFRVRSVAATLVLAGLTGLGAVAPTRAQPPEPGKDQWLSPRQRVRERVVRLRSELDLLKLEYAADRADLSATMKQLRDLRRDGLDAAGKKAVEEVATLFERAKVFGSKEEHAEMLKGGLGQLLQERGIKDPSGHDVARIGVEEETKARDKALSESIAKKKETFARRSREFHEKTLDLDEAEKRYAEIR